MAAVTKDELWLKIFEENDKNEKMTNALWRAEKSMQMIREDRKKRSIKVIEFIPQSQTSVALPRHVVATCKALCYSSGNPCKNKAVTADGFCKKHSLE
jgi:hypothetical protein